MRTGPRWYRAALLVAGAGAGACVALLAGAQALAGAGMRCAGAGITSGSLSGQSGERERGRAGGRARVFDGVGGGSHLRISPPAPDPAPRVPYPLAYIYARVPSGYLAGCARSVWQVAEGTLWDPASKATSAPVVKQQTTGCARPPGRIILHTLWYTKCLEVLMAKQGLYANINAKRERIKAGSPERMRTPGTKGAPTAKAFKESAKTAKKR